MINLNGTPPPPSTPRVLIGAAHTIVLNAKSVRMGQYIGGILSAWVRMARGFECKHLADYCVAVTAYLQGARLDLTLYAFQRLEHGKDLRKHDAVLFYTTF